MLQVRFSYAGEGKKEVGGRRVESRRERGNNELLTRQGFRYVILIDCTQCPVKMPGIFQVFNINLANEQSINQ